MHDDLVRHAGGSRARDPLPCGATPSATTNKPIPVIGLRRKIAQQMQAVKRRIPHFTYVEEVDVTELEALRAQLNAKWRAERGRLTLLPFLVRAIVLAVPEFPQMNARFDDEQGIVTRYGAVHIGIATQTDAGLMVPVVRHAEARDLWASAAEIARLAEAARTRQGGARGARRLDHHDHQPGRAGRHRHDAGDQPPRWPSSASTASSSGPMMRDGAVVPRLMMNLSSSFDHRVVDGQRGRGFVQALRGYLECPALLFVE